MPFLLKTLERLVQWRMQEKAEPFHPDQHAFRKGHCTENALSKMVDTAEKAILRKQVAIVVFLDIKGPFENLSSKAIEDGLNGHKEENDLTEWFCSYLNSRYC
jgi:retron-type reverse transcriptase